MSFSPTTNLSKTQLKRDSRPKRRLFYCGEEVGLWMKRTACFWPSSQRCLPDKRSAHQEYGNAIAKSNRSESISGAVPFLHSGHSLRQSTRITYTTSFKLHYNFRIISLLITSSRNMVLRMLDLCNLYLYSWSMRKHSILCCCCRVLLASTEVCCVR